ncbi:MAG: crosslink repair DNA glycosylase YcaQ family protein [bacterium]
MNKPVDIPLTLARRLAMRRQLLCTKVSFAQGTDGVAQVIDHLGYVQIDTIAVIERAHHHTLWTRREDYATDTLHRLQAVDRRVFEYWGHAASYLPMADYRFYLPKMGRFRSPQTAWEKQRLHKCRHLIKPVLKRIGAEGPLEAADFLSPSDQQRGPWWDWRPAKVALEMLFWWGELMITERRRFRRVYDLTERVLPAGLDTREPDTAELGCFLIRRALNAHGIATNNEIREHIHYRDREPVTVGLEQMLQEGSVVTVTIPELADHTYYMLSDDVESCLRMRPTRPRLHLLSPFDNFVINRERIHRLFGFDYTIECYVPQAKRRYGYFVLPILWGERLVARLDSKAERKVCRLDIRGLFFEPGFEPDDVFLDSLAARLWEMAKFNGCHQVDVAGVRPVKLRVDLKRRLARLQPQGCERQQSLPGPSSG